MLIENAVMLSYFWLAITCIVILFVTALKTNSLGCEDIDYVIGTHGHSDHIGNLNLFPQATFIVSFDICKGNVYIDHDFKSVSCVTLFQNTVS